MLTYEWSVIPSEQIEEGRANLSLSLLLSPVSLSASLSLCNPSVSLLLFLSLSLSLYLSLSLSLLSLSLSLSLSTSLWSEPLSLYFSLRVGRTEPRRRAPEFPAGPLLSAQRRTGRVGVRGYYFPMHFTSDCKAAEMTPNETIDF